jgi:hypothetical protein
VSESESTKGLVTPTASQRIRPKPTNRSERKDPSERRTSAGHRARQPAPAPQRAMARFGFSCGRRWGGGVTVGADTESALSVCSPAVLAGADVMAISRPFLTPAGHP